MKASTALISAAGMEVVVWSCPPIVCCGSKPYQRFGYLFFFTRLLLISCYVIRIFQTYKHSRPGNEFCCWKIWRPSRPINHVGSFTHRYALSPRTDFESPIENFEDAIRRRVTERGSVYKFKLDTSRSTISPIIDHMLPWGLPWEARRMMLVSSLPVGWLEALAWSGRRQ